MTRPALRVFSYLPNPRVWKALIAAEFAGVHLEECGVEPRRLELNSIMRAVARAAANDHGLYGRAGYQASRIDSFLDATLVFAREAQVYLLALRPGQMTADLHGRTRDAFECYLDGIERALGSAPFLAGDAISLADIAFVCDLAQFLTERRSRVLLRESGLALVTKGEPNTHRRTFEHLFRLAEAPEFAKHLCRDLDDARSDLVR